MKMLQPGLRARIWSLHAHTLKEHRHLGRLLPGNLLRVQGELGIGCPFIHVIFPQLPPLAEGHTVLRLHLHLVVQDGLAKHLIREAKLALEQRLAEALAAPPSRRLVLQGHRGLQAALVGSRPNDRFPRLEQPCPL